MAIVFLKKNRILAVKNYGMAKPSPSTYIGYFKRYIDLVEEEDLMTAFKKQTAGLSPFLQSITEEKSTYAYAENKWTIKELLQHAIDTERILSYRALCLARGEQLNLPGFEEDEYAANSFANNRNWSDLIAEFVTVRKSTEMLFESLKKIKALPSQTTIFCTHEYTMTNLRFVEKLIEDEKIPVGFNHLHFAHYREEIKGLRSEKKPTVRLNLKTEMLCNPFLLAGTAEELSELRCLRNHFK